MNNYEMFKAMELEKEKQLALIDDDYLSDVESDYDIYAEQNSTGLIGYVESYHNSSDLGFIVPSQDFEVYVVSEREFNNDFSIIESEKGEPL